eukprot:3384036-Pyramimonas_sp.AAC.1
MPRVAEQAIARRCDASDARGHCTQERMFVIDLWYSNALAELHDARAQIGHPVTRLRFTLSPPQAADFSPDARVASC